MSGRSRWRCITAAGAMTTCLAATVQAVPVRHDNPPGPGHFNWDIGAYFNIFLDGPSQTGTDTNSLGSIQRQSYSEPGLRADSLFAWGDSVFAWQLVNGVDANYIAALSFGQLIPTPGMQEPFQEPWQGFNFYIDFPDYPESAWPDGVPVYAGLRMRDVSASGPYTYGWLGVVRSGFDFDLFAWGYESVPGVPIAAGAPEPGTLALLAFGAIGVMARRRRA